MPSIESNVSQQLENHVKVDMGQLCQKSESVTVCTAVVTTTANTTTNTTNTNNTSPHGNLSTPTATRSTTNKNSSHKEVHPQDSDETCPSPTSTVTSSVQGIDKEEMEDRSEKSSDCSGEIVKVVQQQQDDEEATTSSNAFQNLEKEGEIIVQDKEQEQVPVETQNEDQKFKGEECTTTLLSKILEEDPQEQVAVEEAMPNAKDDGSTHSYLVSNIPPPPSDLPPSSSTRASSNSQSKPRTMHTVMSQQQQALMVESGKLLEHLRKEVYKLRSQNSQLRSDFESLKGNNQRLMDANVSLGNTFDALNKHAKQVSKTNAKLKGDVEKLNEQLEMERQQSKERIDSLELLVMELKDELNMKQETYIQEVHSRLHCQKVMTNIVDMVQERCKDHRLVEDVLGMSDESGF